MGKNAFLGHSYDRPSLSVNQAEALIATNQKFWQIIQKIRTTSYGMGLCFGIGEPSVGASAGFHV